MILLDTQALVWLIENNPRLGPKATRAEAESEKVYVSAMSFWEVSLLVSRDRLTLPMTMDRWVDTITGRAGVEVVAVTGAIAVDAGFLPGYDHGDPGDRLVISTARALGCPVMTSDRRILNYAAAGHVQAIDARQ